jgi:hypothetical protein
VIVKVQRPVGSSGPLESTPWYVYNRDRSVMRVIQPPGEVAQALGRDVKGYFNAELQGEELVLLDRVADQPW